MAAPLGAALYMGTCSGHGVGSGSSHHPGLGGGMLSPCPHPSMSPMVVPKTVAQMTPTTVWPPMAQAPQAGGVTNVIINGKVPILDQDIPTPHPTPTQHTTSSVGFKCAFTTATPAYWCTIGVAAGREAPTGHSRKCFATTKNVFINKRRVGRFSDPLGDTTPAFPCLSTVAGASPNVYIGG